MIFIRSRYVGRKKNDDDYAFGVETEPLQTFDLTMNESQSVVGMRGSRKRMKRRGARGR